MLHSPAFEPLPAVPTDAPTTEPEGHGGWFAGGVTRLPDRIPLLFLAAAISIGFAVSLRELHPWLVAPLFVVIGAALWLWVPRVPGTARADFWGALAAVACALSWVVANAPFASQLLWVTRDPGIYTVLGTWLMHNPAPVIDNAPAVALAQGIPGLNTNLGSFAVPADGQMTLQGGVLLPAMLGVGGWIGGLNGLLVANLVIAGGALVAFYGLARRIVGPWFALVPEIAIGLSIGYLYLSRAAYSEIIMTLMCTAALTWAICAIRERRLWLYLVSGLFAGMTGFARIDGAIAGIGIFMGLAVHAFLVRDNRDAKRRLLGVVLFGAGAGSTLMAAVLAMKHNEPIYYTLLRSQSHLLLLGTVVIGVVALVAVAVRCLIRGGIPDGVLRWVATVAFAVVAVAFAVLLSRPLWFIAHFTTGSAYQQNIESLQRQDGLAADGTRSYDEESLSWFGWYFGWPTLVLIGIGLCVMAYVAIRRRRAGLTLIGLATLSAAALYLVRLQVTPDQPWAFRRVLPVVTIGFLVAAVFPLYILWTRGGWRRIIAGAFGLIVAFMPLVTWNGLIIAPDESNEASLVTSLCDHLDQDEPALLVGDGAPPNMALTIRLTCNVQVVTGFGVTSQTLEAVRARNPETQVVLFAQTAAPGGENLGAPDDSKQIGRWSTDLMKLPNQLVGYRQQFWVGRIAQDGMITD